MLFPFIQIKENHFLGLNKSLAWGYRAKKYKLLLSKFINNNVASRKTISELLKIYLIRLFNFGYLEQYWKFEDK